VSVPAGTTHDSKGSDARDAAGADAAVWKAKLQVHAGRETSQSLSGGERERSASAVVCSEGLGVTSSGVGEGLRSGKGIAGEVVPAVLEEGRGSGVVAVLRRILAYARKVLAWEDALDGVRDSRRRGRIPTRLIVRSMVVMFLSRLGSLHGLSQTRGSRFWRGWLPGEMASADTCGRVAACLNVDELRSLGRAVYTQLKRNKALPAPWHGMIAAVLDGHETHASYRRHCPDCLQRRIKNKDGERIQYYHRLVVLQLVGEKWSLMLDAEPVRPGEDEVTTAMRLLDRVLAAYPRAFDVVLGDSLYAQGPFFNYVLAKGKHVMAVLKDERRDILKDVRSLCDQITPIEVEWHGARCQCWDIEDLRTWEQVSAPVRVIRSLETRSVRRQLTRETEQQTNEWVWATTLPKARISTRAGVALGHSRWTIENEGFNEMVNRWHADHVYRHHGTAILAMWLLAMICLNVFFAFYRRNLKPAARAAATMLHIAREIVAELYSSIPAPRSRALT